MPDSPATGVDQADPPIIDREVWRSLAGMLGQQRMARMTAAFLLDAECRLALLDRDGVTAADIEDHTHGLVSMAGHLGFLRLSALCREVQERARAGGGLESRPALRTALAEVRDAVGDATMGGLAA